MEIQTLQRMCRGRGLVIGRINPPEDLLLPPSGSAEDRLLFKNLLDHYAARLILKEILKSESLAQWNKSRRSVERFCEPQALEGFLEAFARLGVIRQGGVGQFPSPWTPVKSIGPTYEWYVSRVFSDDFGCPSAWGVRFAGMPAGGDHDVIASVSGRFLYLEAKTAPPKHIEKPETSAFIRRLYDMTPDIAIFHNDTHLRMKDKIIPMLEEAITSLREGSSVQGKKRSRVHASIFDGPEAQFERLEREIFHLDSCVYVVNSKPDLKRNLQVILRHHFHEGSAVVKALKGEGD